MATRLPTRENYTVYSGDTFNDTFTFEHDGTPLDLSSATVSMDIRKRKGATAIKSLTTGDGITISGVDNNIATVQFEIDFVGTYKYDVQVVIDGITKTYMFGRFKAKADITE